MRFNDKYVEDFTAEDCYNEATSRRKKEVRNGLNNIGHTIGEAVCGGELSLSIELVSPDGDRVGALAVGEIVKNLTGRGFHVKVTCLNDVYSLYIDWNIKE